MRRFIILLQVFFLSLSTNAQTFDSVRIYPVPVNNKWGYIDCKGDLVIEAQYDYAQSFSNNNQSAIITQNKLYGVINRKGETLVKAQYQDLKRKWKLKDTNGHLYVAYNGFKWGLINLKNEVLLPFEFDLIEACQGQLIVAKNKQYGLYNLKNEELLPIQYKRIEFRARQKGYVSVQNSAKKWALFDLSGQQCGAFLFDYSSMYVANKVINGMCDGNPLTVNFKGKIQKRIKIKMAGFQRNGYTIARAENKKYGILDKDLNWILPPKYDALQYTYRSNRKALVFFMESHKWGLMDLNGSVYLEPNYEYMEYINDSLVVLSKDGEKYRLLNWKNKQYLSDSSYLFCTSFMDGTVLLVKKENRKKNKMDQFGLVDVFGNEILPKKYGSIFVSNGTAQVTFSEGQTYGKGIYDLDKKELLIPPLFSVLFYEKNALTKAIYGVAQNQTIAYLKPDGSVAWASTGFDVEAIMNDYYKNKH